MQRLKCGTTTSGNKLTANLFSTGRRNTIPNRKNTLLAFHTPFPLYSGSNFENKPYTALYIPSQVTANFSKDLSISFD